MPEFSLFNSMDGCLIKVSDRAFEESLLLNILFQERIVVHEALFFNCKRLANHILRHPGRQSLFEAACKRGIVSPAFRSRAVGTLDEAATYMKKEYGNDYNFTSPEIIPLLNRIISSVNIGIKKLPEPFYWPSEGLSLGESYLNLLREMLQTEAAPEYVFNNDNRAQLFERVWEPTKKWRFELIEEAAKRTEAKSATGIQRAELFQVLGSHLGVPSADGPFALERLADIHPDLEMRLAAEVFIKWVTQCHHFNQARVFGTSLNFPVYNVDEDFILDTILRSPLDEAPSSSSGFRCKVQLPAIEPLLEEDPENLVAIRDDIGHGYIWALQKWQHAPTSSNEAEVRESLRQYCDDICSKYNHVVLKPLIASLRTTRATTALGIAETATGEAGSIIPSLSELSTIFKKGVAVYNFFTDRMNRIKYGAREREVEITLSHDGHGDVHQGAGC